MKPVRKPKLLSLLSQDHRIQISQHRKIENYQDLKRELQKMWNLKTSIVPIVIGLIGIIPKSLENISMN